MCKQYFKLVLRKDLFQFIAQKLPAICTIVNECILTTPNKTNISGFCQIHG